LEQASALANENYDVVLIYAAGGGGDILERLVTPKRWNLMFLRHDPGPVYLWYEIAHPRFLRKTVDDYGQPGMDVDDVVVDRHEEVLWRLRALHGLKNTLGKRMIAIGGSGGWGEGGQKAPEIARNLWKMDLVDYPYKDLEPRLRKARTNTQLVSRCEESARRYLREPKVSLHTDRSFITNAFVLTEVMRDLMEEANTDAITIQHCMGTIMGISETTACLPLSLLNDEGYLAFCESDFVVILWRSSALHLRQTRVPERPHLPPRRCRHPRPLHGASENGRAQARARQDLHPFRIRLRRGAQGRDEARPGLHEPGP
jgi:hypothetical protein